MSAHERTGWRDEHYSKRHREEYGFDSPMTDIDCVWVEFDTCEPIAITDMKCTNLIEMSDPSIRTQRRLADLAGLQFYVIRYWPDSWTYYVIAGNDRARNALGDTSALFSELEYVTFLHHIRGRDFWPWWGSSEAEKLNAVAENVRLPELI